MFRKGLKIGLQKLLLRVLGVTLVLFLVGCNAPTIIPKLSTPTQSLPTATHLRSTQTPLPLSMILQVGNDLPRTIIQPKITRELEFNRIGSLCHPPPCVRDDDHINNEYFALGIKGILRLTLNEIESYSIEDGSASEFNISTEDDEWNTSITRDIKRCCIIGCFKILNKSLNLLTCY